MPDLSCPSCGNAVPHELRYAKLVVCPSCQVSLFLEDDAVKHAGERSALVDGPSLFEVGRPFYYGGGTYVPHGRIRYDYGRGWWDEWWVGTDAGQAVWVSVDEGDIVMQEPLNLNGPAPAWESLQLGTTLSVGSQNLTVTERNEANCVGFQGELPEFVQLGQVHRFVHLSGPKGLLLTIEFDDETQVYKGFWLDPFEITS